MLVLALLPSDLSISTGWDKGDHVFAFSVLAVLGIRSYPAFIVPVVVGLFLYGGLIEVLQAVLPWRHAEWLDILADSVGVLIGWGVERLVRFSGH